MQKCLVSRIIIRQAYYPEYMTVIFAYSRKTQPSVSVIGIEVFFVYDKSADITDFAVLLGITCLIYKQYPYRSVTGTFLRKSQTAIIDMISLCFIRMLLI